MIVIAGVEWGTAAEIAAVLTSPERPVNADRVRDWARRSRRPGDRLHGMLVAYHRAGPRRGTTWYRLDQAAHIEMITRGIDKRQITCVG